MSRSSSGVRGPYAKGVARRQEIIAVALEVLATQGLRNSTLEDIAARVGITRPGLLHYFDSKEELLLAVLEERDNRDLAAAAAAEQAAGSAADATVLDGVERAVARTKTAPGLARLYTELAAEATDPGHPAHEWFQRRYERIRALGRAQIEARIAAGDLDASVDAEALSQLMPALMDGLQLQWLLDPDLDTTAALRMAVSGLLEHLTPKG
jgi:AcrR family transcriptional regulator